MNIIAFLLKQQGKYDEAEAMYRRVLAGREIVLGAEHPDTLSSMENLAVFFHSQDKYDDAEPIARRALAGREMILGTGHPAH